MLRINRNFFDIPFQVYTLMPPHKWMYYFCPWLFTCTELTKHYVALEDSQIARGIYDILLENLNKSRKNKNQFISKPPSLNFNAIYHRALFLSGFGSIGIFIISFPITNYHENICLIVGLSDVQARLPGIISRSLRCCCPITRVDTVATLYACCYCHA